MVCCWLTVSGLIHIIVEGPVVCNQNFFRDNPADFFSELCIALDSSTVWHHGIGKEYGKADSRYLTRDGCTIGIEAITVFFEGPVCLLLVLAFTRRWSWRHAVTLVIVVGELYGTVLYFLTSIYDGELNFLWNGLRGGIRVCLSAERMDLFLVLFCWYEFYLDCLSTPSHLEDDFRNLFSCQITPR